MSTTNSAGSHSHTLKGTSTYAAGSHRHDYTDLVGEGVPGPAGPTGPTGPTGPAGPPGVEDPATSARIDALEARVAALEGTPPPPPPPPASRPFPAPVTTRTVAVPATIDATGATDVAGALASFIASVPDGSVVTFPLGATYRVSRGIALTGRRNLVLAGNGAKIISVGSMGSMWSDPIVINGAATTDIVVRDLALVGGNAKTEPAIYDPAQEVQAGVGIYGGQRIEVVEGAISRTGGDGVYVADDSAHVWAADVWVHDSTLATIGRNAFTANAGRRLTIERNTIDQVGGSVLDIEPDTDWQGVAELVLRGNAVGDWGLSPMYTMHFVACASQWEGVASTVNDVTITGNVVAGGPPESPNNPSAPSLKTWIGKPARQSRIVFTDNIGQRTGRGPALRFEHVDGLVVRGNVQPLTSGALTSIVDCTGVVTA